MNRKFLHILVTKKDKTSQLTAKRKLIQAIKKSNFKRQISDFEEKMFHSDDKSTERLSKRMYNCTRKICNPGCKNTIFEPGR